MIIIAGKVQVRRGLGYELPGSPISQNPLAFGPGLDIGEIAFTEDDARVFIGHNPVPGDINYQRAVYPYQNVEVLTENSPRNEELFNGFIQDQDSNDFFTPFSIAAGSAPLAYANTAVLNPSVFNGDNISATIEYHAFTPVPSVSAVRQGTLRIMGTGPTITISDDFIGQSTLTFSVSYASGKYTLLCDNTGSTVNLFLRRIVLTGF